MKLVCDLHRIYSVSRSIYIRKKDCIFLVNQIVNKQQIIRQRCPEIKFGPDLNTKENLTVVVS